MTAAPQIQDLTPEQVKTALSEGKILLVDVREPSEFAAERIHGALNFPLSTFDSAALPQDADPLIVFQCGSGKRSAMAVERAQAKGAGLKAHLAGGLQAWKAAGLPTVTLDVATGDVRDAR